ncbi:hypothetical protein [Rhodobacter ferrooxidans]|uniref:Uncharacterized protein n=1 Tax=Rhodobacter ferrooxidans TaxID=371731 RepID=C8RWB6_9RHOB|nr:hypothetical protein [Rhodobacter sp. SW2]EEW26859.1 conserved hypothetical protein [Rhodobacter sp. SW2]
MALYAFRLDLLHVLVKRGKLTDSDVVTFAVLVNKVERGAGAGLFPALADNTQVPTAAVAMTSRRGAALNWIIGPFELEPDDAVDVIFTATNTSDSQISDQDAERLQLKIMDEILTTAIGAIGGPIGAALGFALGSVTDPVAKFLGWEPRGPCNGLVLADSVAFSGAALGRLGFGPVTVHNSFNSLPNATEFSMTKDYTDAANHDTEICGEVARTEMTFSVLALAPPISTAFYAKRRKSPVGSLAGLRPGGDPVGVKSLLGILP